MEAEYLDSIESVLPDNIKVILQHLHISSHLLAFTAISFLWCFAKVILAFITSSKKESELKGWCAFKLKNCFCNKWNLFTDKTCKIERKLFYVEAERQKVKEEIESHKEKVRKTNNFLFLFKYMTLSRLC